MRGEKSKDANMQQIMSTKGDEKTAMSKKNVTRIIGIKILSRHV